MPGREKKDTAVYLVQQPWDEAQMGSCSSQAPLPPPMQPIWPEVFCLYDSGVGSPICRTDGNKGRTNTVYTVQDAISMGC